MWVLDLSETLPGPYAALLLQQLGADVLKVERPAGDPLAALMPQLYRLINHRKAVVRLDLKQRRARDRLYGWFDAGADVLLTSYRPGVRDRLGLGDETLNAGWPGLIHSALSGYGQDGPMAKRPTHDINVRGSAGLVRPSAISGHRVVVDELPYVDLAAGALAAMGVTAALHQRAAGSQTDGRVSLDTAMIDVALSWAAMKASYQPGFDTERETPGCYGVFLGSDRVPLTCGIIEDAFWERAVQVLADPRLRTPRFATAPGRITHRENLRTLLTEVFATRPAVAWVADLKDRDVPVELVRSFQEAVDDSDINHRHVVRCAPEGLSIGPPTALSDAR